MDRFYQQRFKILGGPGCGKTTKILTTLREYFNKGLQPKDVLMIGFANATVDNLRLRAQKEMNYSEKQAESIKTFHKYCKDSIDHYDIFTRKVKREFVQKIQTDSDNWVMLDDSVFDRTGEAEAVGWSEAEDKKLGLIFSLIGNARHDALARSLYYNKKNKTKESDIEEILDFSDSHPNFQYSKLTRSEIRYCYQQLINFKTQNNVIDFEDMLEKALAPNIIFDDYKVVMVDEVQDLSWLEWRVVAKLGKTAEEMYLVGDDDQSIFAWKGSDSRIFQKWPCKKEHIKILPTTHRLPQKVYRLAKHISHQITHRLGNEYDCKKSYEGKVDFLHDTGEFDPIIDIDSNLIMCARTWKNCHGYIRYLKDRGIIWKEKSRTSDNRGSLVSSFPKRPRSVIDTWNTLKKGQAITTEGDLSSGKLIIRLIEDLKPGLVKHGKKGALTKLDTCPEEFKDKTNSYSFSDLKEKYYVLADINKPWYEVFYFSTTRKSSGKKPNGLFRDDDDFNNYLKMCWDNDSTLSKADIIVSTIHGVKGMERKKVILSSNWGFGSLKSYNSGIIRLEDEEIRVCYVGVSRAEEELYIFNPTYKNTFPLLSQEALRGVL
jgi:superfamily I DNA/RNA helicase